MAEIIKKITVDVMGENLFESIVAKQNDYNSRFLNVTFVSENDIIEIDPSSTVLINALRADSEAKSFAGTVNEDGTVTVPLTSWMLELDDVVKCDISIIDDSSRKLTSTLFTVTVEEAANGNGDDISEDENYDVLLTLIAECKAATEEAQKVTEKQSELQTDINNLRAEVNVMSGDLGYWMGSDTVYQAVTKLKAKDADLQSQINMLSGVDMSEFQSQLDNKSDATNLVNGSAEGSLRGICAEKESSEYTMGVNAVALGYETSAGGDYSHAEGYRTSAGGDYSHAEGYRTSAGGDYSHAEGYRNSANGDYSHAEGLDTIAHGDNSHAEGSDTVSVGENSHAEGLYTIANGSCQHVQGRHNIPDNSERYAHIVGNGEDEENRSNAHTLDWDGNAWFAGDVLVGGTSQDDENAIKLTDISNTTADLQSQITAEISHRQSGDENLQSQIDNKSDATNLVNGPAEGSLRSICSHGEQYIGDWAVTLGYGTFASGLASHAEGFYNSASGEHSHAEGQHNHANGENSHAEGSDTIANGSCQHVQGRYNIEDKSERYAHIVGNGHDDFLGGRSNAHTLDWNGNAWFAGDVLVGGVSQDDENAINLVNISTENKTDIESLKAKDTDLQSQINTKVTRKVAIVGSDVENSAGWYKVASGAMTKYQVISLLFTVHTPATSGKHSGILQLDLRGGTESIDTGDALKLGWLVRAGFDSSQVIVVVDGYDWALYFNVQSPRFFRTFFEVIQESSGNVDKATYNLHTNSVVETTAPVATAISVDLGTVNTANKLTTARNINGIAFDGSADINITANDIASTSGQTVYQTIVDLTARIEALENSASGSTITRTLLIDWDVNTNGSTQGTVSKDADGLHASGSTSMRIANYWSNNVSAYDGITFTAYGSGKLRVEVGGVESSYVVLSTTPTTFTFDFAENGLTDLSSVEINLQTQGVYDLTVSDIYGYTKS